MAWCHIVNHCSCVDTTARRVSLCDYRVQCALCNNRSCLEGFEPDITRLMVGKVLLGSKPPKCAEAKVAGGTLVLLSVRPAVVARQVNKSKGRITIVGPTITW